MLVYDARRGAARLVDLGDGPLGAVAMCRPHADRVGVPGGWTLVDERSSGLGALYGGAAGEPDPAAIPRGRMLQRAFRSASSEPPTRRRDRR